MGRRGYYWFVYASLAALLLALHEADYLRVPEVRSMATFAASVVLLLAGFAVSGTVWQRSLHRVGVPSGYLECLAATGLSVFGKYLPGKLWVIVGRAAYVAPRHGASLVSLSAASASSQLASLWVGLALGAVALVHLDGLGVWGLLVAVAWLGLSAAVFLAPVHDRLEALARRIAGAAVRIPLLGAGDVASLAPWYAAMWLAWSAGFQLLVVALWAGPTPWSVGLIFPLAAGLGMMAVVLPGGLGAREGVMVSCLALAGMPVAEATSAAITARLWFLLGEGAVFVAGWMAHRSLAPPPAGGSPAGDS